DNWWRANKAREALRVEWAHADMTGQDSDAFARHAAEVGPGAGEEIVYTSGDYDAAMQQAATTVEAAYSYPFLAHATLEPQNTTAHVQGDMVEIWSPAQWPRLGANLVASTLGVPA